MIRGSCWRSSVTSTFAVVVAVAMLAPVYASGAATDPFYSMAPEAGISAKSSDDIPDEGSNLVAMGDFNRDGIADIAKATLPAEGKSGPGSLTVWLGQTDGNFKQLAPSAVLDRTPRSVVVGDFNQDGMSDVIVGDDDGSLRLFLGDGQGNLTTAGDIAHLNSVVSIAEADFNHDGVQDLAVTDWRASSVTVLLGSGNGSFRRAWSVPLRMPGTVPHISVADFNGDGIPDLAVVYDNDDGDTFEVMLGNGNGTFTDAPDRSFVKDPNSHCAT